MLARGARWLRPRPVLRGSAVLRLSRGAASATTQRQVELLGEATTRWSEECKCLRAASWLLPRLKRALLRAGSQLVEWEQGAETTASQQRIAHWGAKRLRAEGHMMDRMAARMEGYNGTDLVLGFSPKPQGGGLQAAHQRELPEAHRFSSGDAVTVCRGNPQDKRLIEGRDRFDGIVVRVDADSLHVKVSGSVDLPADVLDGHWRLDRGANAVSTERQIQALKNMSESASEDSPCDKWLKALLLDDEDVWKELRTDAVKVAREAPQGVPTAFFRAGDTGELQTDSEEIASLLDDARLNDSQRLAVTTALSQRLTLIQGPPGTGKTHTAVQLLNLFVAKQRLTGSQKEQKSATVLAVANSNTAADNLLEGLLEQGVQAVRAGQETRVRPHLQGASLAQTIDGHAAQKVMRQLEELVRDLSEDLRRMRDGDVEEAKQAAPARSRKKRGRHAEVGLALTGMQVVNAAPKTESEVKAKLERARSSLEELRRQVVADIVQSAEVVVATCIAAGELADTGLFKVVLLDEASQCTVPAALCPIAKGCRQLVLVGDSNQLPPTVKTDKAMEGGLNVSLFERLQDMGISSMMLNQQYRMHPSIAAFPSSQFYQGKLENAQGTEALHPPVGFDWPLGADGQQQGLSFVPVDGAESVALDRTSKANLDEATAVMSTLRGMLAGGELKAEDIGVVTPYRGQVELVQKLLSSEEEFAGLEVNSVDGYQGREKEVILFSCVRANEDGRVGFLADWRRLNVGLTRSRRGLVIFGHLATLRNDPVWAAWLDHMAGAGALTVTDAPVESAASQPEQAVRAEAEPLVEERGLMAALGSS